MTFRALRSFRQVPAEAGLRHHPSGSTRRRSETKRVRSSPFGVKPPLPNMILGLFFWFWRSVEILTLIPTLGMLVRLTLLSAPSDVC